MYAVIKLGGHQYRVASGDKVVVDRLSGAVGDTTTVPALLVAEGKEVTLGTVASQTPVTVKIVSHGQGEKVHVRRFRAKSRTRRHTGFRSQLTEITVEAIGTLKATAVKKAPKAAKPVPANA